MTCATCNGTGEVGSCGYLDCTAPGCTLAEERRGLNMAIIQLTAEHGRMNDNDLQWVAYRLGKMAALASIAANERERERKRLRTIYATSPTPENLAALAAAYQPQQEEQG